MLQQELQQEPSIRQRAAAAFAKAEQQSKRVAEKTTQTYSVFTVVHKQSQQSQVPTSQQANKPTTTAGTHFLAKGVLVPTAD